MLSQAEVSWTFSISIVVLTEDVSNRNTKKMYRKTRSPWAKEQTKWRNVKGTQTARWAPKERPCIYAFENTDHQMRIRIPPPI